MKKDIAYYQRLVFIEYIKKLTYAEYQKELQDLFEAEIKKQNLCNKN